MTNPEKSVGEIVERAIAIIREQHPGYEMELENLIVGAIQTERQKREEMVEAVKLQAGKEILKCVTAECDDCYYLCVAKDSPLFITQPNNQ